MKKKLMVAAVAGALAMPAVALAQSSSVQMYGVFNLEYAPYVDNPDNGAGVERLTTDEFNSGASRIGFRGQEKLGGNLTAWFQCETDVEFLDGGVNSITDNSEGTWCGRNSALGLRGGWGNLYFGNWDSPAKRVTSATRMLNETGWLGAQRLLMTHAGFNYSFRTAKSINYDSPNMGGFTFALQTTPENPARNLTDTVANAGAEGRVYGVNAIYRSGPLVVAAAYQLYEDNIQLGTPGVSGNDDTVAVVGVNYTFGAFKLGGVVTQIDAERGVGADTDRLNYNAALDWKLGGPHTIRFGWTHAGGTDGPGAVAGFAGSANQYQVQYRHSLSKRTTAAIGYVMLDNGKGGRYNLQALSTDVSEGDKAQAVAIQLTHSF